MRQRRYPLLLDTDYPPENAVLRAIHAVPEGERAAFMRALMPTLSDANSDMQRSSARTL